MPEVISRERNASKMMSNTQFNSRSRSKGAAAGGPGPESPSIHTVHAGKHNGNLRGVTFDPKSVHLESTNMLGGQARNSGFNYRLKEPQSVMEMSRTDVNDASGPEF